MRDNDSRRKAADMLFHAALAIGLLPVLIAVTRAAPAHPLLLLALLAIAFAAQTAEVRLRNGLGLDPTTAISLIALVLAGPAVALGLAGATLIFDATVLPRIGRAHTERRRLLRAGNISNISSTGWALLAAAGILSLTGSQSLTFTSLPGIFLAGVAASFCQLVLGPCIHETLWNRYSLRDVLRFPLQAARADIATIALVALTAALLDGLGVGALALLAGVVVLLPALTPLAARSRPMGTITSASAASMYAEALAGMLGMGRAEQRQLPSILTVARKITASGLLAEIENGCLFDPATMKLTLARHEQAFAAWTISESWDGSGPTNIGGEDLPPAARLLAVAGRWAFLTAAGGPELSHDQALGVRVGSPVASTGGYEDAPGIR